MLCMCHLFPQEMCPEPLQCARRVNNSQHDLQTFEGSPGEIPCSQEYGAPERYPNDPWPDSLKECPSSLVLYDTTESRENCLFLYNRPQSTHERKKK